MAREMRSLILIVAALATGSFAYAQQQSNTAPAAPQAAAYEESSAETTPPAVSNLPNQLTVEVRASRPSEKTLRQAREAGFKIKVVDGITHFCKTEAPVGTRFQSENCMNEEQVTMVLIQSKAQREQLQHMLGAPSSVR